MNLTLSSRPGADTSRPPGLSRPAPDRSLMARCLAYLFGAGAALAMVALVLSDSSELSAGGIVIPPADYAIAGAEGAFALCERVRHRAREVFSEDHFSEAAGQGNGALTVSLGIATFPAV